LDAPGGAATPLTYAVLDERVASAGGPPQILELDDGGFVVLLSRLSFDATAAPVEAGVFVQRFDATGAAVSDLTEVAPGGANEFLGYASQLDDGRVIVTAGSIATPTSTTGDVLDFEIVFEGDGGGAPPTQPPVPGETIDGGLDADLLTGTAGDDTIRGFAERDTLFGGDGDDALRGGIDNDRLRGDAGDDEARGQGGADRLFGQLGDDTLIGGLGEDTLKGAADDDRLVGGGAADRLFGGIGDDRLNGSAGEDRLIGGAGDDFLTGGTGADRFIFRTNVGDDVIADFENGVDLVRIQSGAERFADLAVTADGADVIVAFTGTTIRFRDTAEGEIDASDFLF
ncbi:MAG: calcium-binding protein, partial [Pseudomonadota bacterium]